MRAAPVDPDDARRAAQHILSDHRFRASPTPRPLHSPLQWLGDHVLAPIGRFFERLPVGVWLLAAAAVIVGLVWFIVRARARRGSRVTTTSKRTRVALPEAEDPDALERAADDAERAGDLQRAIRLRFRAGLLRLGDRGAIEYRPSVTTGEVRRTLDSRRFDDLAGTFEAVTYGGQPAEAPDTDAARREWPRVLEETKRR